jgi:hypothetical protein
MAAPRRLRGYEPLRGVPFVAAVLLAAAAAIPARGVNWDGGGTTSEWLEAANWQFNALPTTADAATIVNDTATITGVTVPGVMTIQLGMGSLPGGLTMTGGVNQANINVVTNVAVASAGSLALGGGGPALSTLTAGSLTTDGTTSVLSRGVVNLSGQLAQNGGTLNLSGGTIAAATVLSHAGVFNAAGTVNGNLSIGDDIGSTATLALGESLDVNGNLKLVSDARLEVQFRPTSGGGGVFDTIDVSGTATLGGVLDLSVVAPATPVPGVNYVFLTAGTVRGSFDDILGAAVGNGSWVPELGLTNGVQFSYSEQRGNMNNLGGVDEDDVGLFAWAIRDANSYHADYYIHGSVAEAFMADMDLDGSNTFADIPLFLDLVAQNGGSTQAALAGILAVLNSVPEPGASSIASILAVAAAFVSRRRQRPRGCAA